MKLIALILVAAAAPFVIQQLNDPSSDFGSTAQQVWSDIQNAGSSVGGYGSGDYDCSNAGRPNPSDWAARGGSSVGDSPYTQPLFGHTSDLSQAKAQMDEAYNWYRYELETFGEGASRVQRARQDYLNAKYHYDSLAKNAHQGW